MDFPAMVEQAKQRLNGMFNADDYPPASEIVDRFKFELDYNTVAQWDGSHLAVDLRDDEVKRIGDLMAAKADEKLANAMKDVWQRLYDQVRRIAERLSHPENVFRDSLIGNVANLVNILPTLNITDDPNLEQMRRDVERILASQDPQELRDDIVKRKHTCDDANAILSAMVGYVGVTT
jgi:predicted secreted Zn-dependent protease